MRIVCGLGNPGARYRHTRHNVGFEICARLAERMGVSFSQTKFSSDIAQGRVGDGAVLLMKPQTYMNKSGRAVAPVLNYYKLSPADLLVIHDDADLDPGRILIKKGGGTAGHKGLNSIRNLLGNSDFDRLRYGVGRPDDARMDLSDYVLAQVSEEEKRFHETRFEIAADAAWHWIVEGPDAAMNVFNSISQ
ncbi:MAG: aminoacyl-tRNA hydrolase [Candidatus Lernaella stagnicola]|nr:aminoacyl-tRNA hydrolase [Candidatus Lernaella stagnicola]